MSDLPSNPLSREQHHKLMEQMYLLMDKQVQSYHRHRRMGSSTSVPTELAQELMASIAYTINQGGGIFAHPKAEDVFKLGQEILGSKVRRAKSMLELIDATSPHWQTECRFEAIRYLRHYVQHYDHLHLAHTDPNDFFYPILLTPPKGIQGIDCCLFYLNALWAENQIMAAFPDDVLNDLWDRLPAAAPNQCEHLLINGIGKVLIGSSLDPLSFHEESRQSLIDALKDMTSESLTKAAKELCHQLRLQDENARAYVESVVPQLALWIGENTSVTCVKNLFI